MLHNMVHSILKGLGGVEQYGVVSLCLFCLVFGGVMVSVCFLKRGHLDYMARAALEDGDAGQEAESGRALKRDA